MLKQTLSSAKMELNVGLRGPRHVGRLMMKSINVCAPTMKAMSYLSGLTKCPADTSQSPQT